MAQNGSGSSAGGFPTQRVVRRFAVLCEVQHFSGAARISSPLSKTDLRAKLRVIDGQSSLLTTDVIISTRQRLSHNHRVVNHAIQQGFLMS